MSVVVLLSGGVDSALLLWRAGVTARSVFVDYAQPSVAQEHAAATNLTDRRGSRFCTIIATLPLGAMDAPVGEPGPRVVPGRNLALCSIGISVAAAEGADEVWFGAHSGDHDDYPDCRPSFVAALDRLAAENYGVRVKAPLLLMDRRAILREARALGVPLDLCWSCYSPIVSTFGAYRACGTCNSCRQDR